MSSYHVLKKLGISTTLANKKFAHSEIRKHQLESLNMNTSDILKAFQLSKSAKREDIQRAVAEYKNTYNLSVKWAIKMSGHKRTIGGMLLAMYLIDEALERVRGR
jgi:hypothetical protein